MKTETKQKTYKVLKVIGIGIGALVAIQLYQGFFGYQNYVTKQTVQEEASYRMEDSAAVQSRNNLGGQESQEADAIFSETKKDSSGLVGSVAQATERRVIKNGNLSLKVEELEKASDEIERIAKEQQGEVFSTDFNQRSSRSRSGRMTVRVPVVNFEATIKDLKEAATQVLSESTSGRDVTEQYVDLQAQLKNKQAEEQAFTELLERSGDMEEVLEVTKELSRVRGEIERLQGKIRYLESQTDFSTIVVYLSEDAEVLVRDNDWRPGQVAKEAATELIQRMQEFVNNLISFAIVTLPSLVVFVLIFGGGLYLVYRGGKRIWRRK